MNQEDGPAEAGTWNEGGGRKWTQTIPQFWRFVFEYLVLLPIGAGLALTWVNLRPESYYAFVDAAAFWVNDVAMVFFFGLVLKEVVEATAAGGVLHSWRRLALPVMGAIGAAVAARLVHLAFVDYADEPMLAMAWPVPIATDVALAYFLARLTFKPQHPVIPFVILLGLAADSIGFIALAWYDTTPDLRLVEALAYLAVAIAVSLALRRMRVKTFWPYAIVGGGLSWWAFYRGGFHPALALLPILPIMPHAARDPGFFVDARPDAQDALSRFELFARYPAQAALFFFGLVNAGVPFRGLELGTWAVPVAALVGKPLGLLIAVGVAVAAGLHLPPKVGWRDMVVVSLIASFGFTVALFFSAAMLGAGQLFRETTMGTLLGLMGIPLVFVLARLLCVGRFAKQP
jgi:NhaA family Na+:H+ antiporter